MDYLFNYWKIKLIGLNESFMLVGFQLFNDVLINYDISGNYRMILIPIYSSIDQWYVIF